MFQIFPFDSLMVRTTPPAEWNSPSTTSGAPSVVPVSGMTRTPQFCVACSITQAAAHWATVNSARATGQSGSPTYVVKETKNPSLTARCLSTSRGQPWVECLYQGEAIVTCASLTTRTLPYNATTQVPVYLCLLKHTFSSLCVLVMRRFWLQYIYSFFLHFSTTCGFKRRVLRSPRDVHQQDIYQRMWRGLHGPLCESGLQHPGIPLRQETVLLGTGSSSNQSNHRH